MDEVDRNILIINLHDALMKDQIKTKGINDLPCGEVYEPQYKYYKFIVNTIFENLSNMGYIK